MTIDDFRLTEPEEDEGDNPLAGLSHDELEQICLGMVAKGLLARAFIRLCRIRCSPVRQECWMQTHDADNPDTYQ